MPYITIKDWKPGLLTFDPILTLKNKYGFGLKEAKKAVEDLVARKHFIKFEVSEENFDECIIDMDSFHITYEIKS